MAEMYTRIEGIAAIVHRQRLSADLAIDAREDWKSREDRFVVREYLVLIWRLRWVHAFGDRYNFVVWDVVLVDAIAKFWW